MNACVNARRQRAAGPSDARRDARVESASRPAMRGADRSTSSADERATSAMTRAWRAETRGALMRSARLRAREDARLRARAEEEAREELVQALRRRRERRASGSVTETEDARASTARARMAPATNPPRACERVEAPAMDATHRAIDARPLARVEAETLEARAMAMTEAAERLRASLAGRARAAATDSRGAS